MPNTAEVLEQVSKLLQEGKVQEADDLAKKAAADAHAASQPASGAAAPPPPPRAPAVITHDLLAAIVTHMGNPPRIHALITELERASKPK